MSVPITFLQNTEEGRSRNTTTHRAQGVNTHFFQGIHTNQDTMIVADRRETSVEIVRHDDNNCQENETTDRQRRIGMGRRSRSFSNPRGVTLETKTFSPKHLLCKKQRLQLTAEERQQLMMNETKPMSVDQNDNHYNPPTQQQHGKRRFSWHSGNSETLEPNETNNGTDDSWNLPKELAKEVSNTHETSSITSSSDLFADIHHDDKDGNNDSDRESEPEDETSGNSRNQFAQERSIQLIPEPEETIRHDWQTQVYLQQQQQQQQYHKPNTSTASFLSKENDKNNNHQKQETPLSASKDPQSDGEETNHSNNSDEQHSRFKLCTQSSERIKAHDPTINYSDTSITLLQALEKEAEQHRRQRLRPDSDTIDENNEQEPTPRRSRSHSFNTSRSRRQTILPSQVAKSTNNKRAQFQRWGSYKMQKSHNQAVEADAKEVGSLVPVQPTPLLALLEKELLQHHQHKRAHRASTSAPKSCLGRRRYSTDKNRPGLKRSNLAVRFAINPSNGNAWCLTQTYLKVSSKYHHRLWYSSDELQQTYNDHYDEIPEETEDAYADLLELAFESVDTTRPTCTDPDLPFADFMACGDVRGLEARVFAISDHVQRHREAVLDTQQLLYEESWVGGMDDDLQQEVLRLRSFKYSHPCRMMCQKLAEYDRRVLDLYRDYEQSMYGSLYDDSDIEDSKDADFIFGKED